MSGCNYKEPFKNVCCSFMLNDSYLNRYWKSDLFITRVFSDRRRLAAVMSPSLPSLSKYNNVMNALYWHRRTEIILSVHKNKISLISNHLRHNKIFLKSNWLLELAINSTIHSVLILFMVHAYDVMNCRKIFRIKVPIMLLSHLSQRPIRKS